MSHLTLCGLQVSLDSTRISPIDSQHGAVTHHVWLLGSQVSFPTLSMQNFWGPLLPAGGNEMNQIFASLDTVTPLSHDKPISYCDSWFCTYELSKSSDRKPAGSCHELKKADPLLVVHLLHHLQEQS